MIPLDAVCGEFLGGQLSSADLRNCELSSGTGRAAWWQRGYLPVAVVVFCFGTLWLASVWLSPHLVLSGSAIVLENGVVTLHIVIPDILNEPRVSISQEDAFLLRLYDWDDNRHFGLCLPTIHSMGWDLKALEVPMWLVIVTASIATYVLCARRTRRRPHGLCGVCGYDMRGNTSGRCPECGCRNGSQSGIGERGSGSENGTFDRKTDRKTGHSVRRETGME